jgi:hypothetical protein
MTKREGKSDPRTGLKTGHYIRKGEAGWEAGRLTGGKRDPSTPRPDAPQFGAEEKIGPLRSG